MGEQLVHGLLAEGAERGPLAAYHREDGEMGGFRGRGDLAGVRAAHLARRGRAGGAKRAHARERAHNLRAVDPNVGEQVLEAPDHGVDLAVVAAGRAGVIDADVGRAEERLAEPGHGEDRAAIRGLVEEHLAVECPEQLRVVEHEVAAFRARNELRLVPQAAVREVDPGARGIDDDLGPELELPARQLVPQGHGVAGGALE